MGRSLLFIREGISQMIILKIAALGMLAVGALTLFTDNLGRDVALVLIAILA